MNTRLLKLYRKHDCTINGTRWGVIRTTIEIHGCVRGVFIGLVSWLKSKSILGGNMEIGIKVYFYIISKDASMDSDYDFEWEMVTPPRVGDLIIHDDDPYEVVVVSWGKPQSVSVDIRERKEP